MNNLPPSKKVLLIISTFLSGITLPTTVSAQWQRVIDSEETTFDNNFSTQVQIIENGHQIIHGGIHSRGGSIEGGAQTIDAVYPNTTVINMTIIDGQQKIMSGLASGTILQGPNAIQILNDESLYLLDAEASYTTILEGAQEIVHGSATDTRIEAKGMQILHDGTTSNTSNNGGLQNIHGGTASDNTLNMGATQNISGGTAEVTNINTNAVQNIINGRAENTTINITGVQNLISGEASNTVNNRGQQNIKGGTAYLNILNKGAVQTISGGTANETTINAKSIQDILSGTAKNTTTNDGGMQNLNGGIAQNSTLNAGAIQTINSGYAVETNINNKATQTIIDGVADETTINAGGTQNLIEGLAIYTINNGGTQNITGGAADINTLNEGAIQAISGGEVSETILNTGSTQTITKGIAKETSVNADSTQNIQGGTAEKNTINAGATQNLTNGLAIDTLNNGGIQNIAGGIADTNTLSNGAIQTITAGLAKETTVNADSTQNIQGGTAEKNTINAGATQNLTDGLAIDTLNNGGRQNITGGVAQGIIATQKAVITVSHQGELKDHISLKDSALSFVDADKIMDTRVDISGTSNITSNIALVLGNIGTLHFNDAHDYEMNFSVQSDQKGGGALNVSQGSLTLNANNQSFSGVMNIKEQGTLIADSDALSGTINVDQDALLVIQQTKKEGNISAHTTISGNGNIEKTGHQTLGFDAPKLNLQGLHIKEGAVKVSNGQQLNIGSLLTVDTPGSLKVSVGSEPAILTNALTMGNSIIEVAGVDQLQFGQEYTLIQSQNNITGTFKARDANGKDLSTDIDLSTYIFGGVYQSADQKSILAKTDLVWNHDSKEEAHGTFFINPQDAVFTLNQSLSDQDMGNLSNRFNWNGKTLTKTGSGTLILNAKNDYTGLTTIESGKLLIGGDIQHSDAQVTSDILVKKGTLGGHGSIYGHVTVENGGIISPGSKGFNLGSLSMGSLTLKEGSTYRFESDPTGADKTIIDSNLKGTGFAMIESGVSLNIIAGAGTWLPDETYTLLTADKGVVGTFEKLQKDTIFLEHEVIYGNNHVSLAVKRNDIKFNDLGGTINQQQTGLGVESLGKNDLIYDEIVSMDREQALQSFDALSGEIHTSAKTALLNHAQRVKNVAVNHLRSSKDSPQNLWVNTWAQRGALKGDSYYGSAKTTHSSYGIFIGKDLIQNHHMRWGVALGYEDNNIKTNLRRSTADTQTLHLLTYGEIALDQWIISGGLNVSKQKLDVKRDISVGHLQSHNSAKYNANVMQVFARGEYNIPTPSAFSFAPFIEGSYQQIKTANIHEKGAIGALRGEGKTDRVFSTSIGVSTRYQLNEKSQFYGSLAWKHQSKKQLDTNFRFKGGDTFNIKGALLDKNSAIINIGAAYAPTVRQHYILEYNADLGSHAKSHDIKLLFEHQF